MDVPVVLIVDDETDFREIMEKRLKKRGLHVFAAPSGTEALEQLHAHQSIDVMVLDVKMPGMDGIAVLREAKKAHPLVEVIMLTGHATVDSAIEGLRLGAYDYLMKPCDLTVLLGKIDEALARKKGAEQKALDARTGDILLRRGT
jgi:DNA-binding NtrC family response regulator